MLQFTDDFTEQIFLILFCLIYQEFCVPDPNNLLLSQNTVKLWMLFHLTGNSVKSKKLLFPQNIVFVGHFQFRHMLNSIFWSNLEKLACMHNFSQVCVKTRSKLRKQNEIMLIHWKCIGGSCIFPAINKILSMKKKVFEERKLNSENK